MNEQKKCSLKTCNQEAAFDIFAGHNYFDTIVVAHACAFDRIEVESILSRKYESVQWHDV